MWKVCFPIPSPLKVLTLEELKPEKHLLGAKEPEVYKGEVQEKQKLNFYFFVKEQTICLYHVLPPSSSSLPPNTPVHDWWVATDQKCQAPRQVLNAQMQNLVNN